MAKKKDLFAEVPSKTLKELYKSEIFGPNNYLEGMSDSQILSIAKPLIEKIQLGEIVCIDNTILFSPKEGMAAALTEIKNCSQRGKELIVYWLYYHRRDERDKLLNPII